MQETWKDIPEYIGKYQVSNFGRVRGLDYCVMEKGGKSRMHKGHILRTYKVTGGYSCVQLFQNNTRKHFLVHRLVAMVFIPNPFNYDTVNHKDEDPTNNRVDNLEWLSLYQNNRYGCHDSNMRKRLSIPVKQFTLKGEFIREYPSVASVKQYGFNPAGVCKAATGKLKTYRGFNWTY